MLNRASALLFAYHLSREAIYRDTALRQLDYIFGTNALDRSFVAGHGENAVTHPYHWTCVTQGIALPGWASGGPNGGGNGGDTMLEALRAQGTPPQKCHVDACTGGGSFASNEGQTSENAVLVFVTGYLQATQISEVPNREPSDAAVFDAPTREAADVAPSGEGDRSSGAASRGGCSMPGRVLGAPWGWVIWALASAGWTARRRSRPELARGGRARCRGRLAEVEKPMYL